MSDDKPDIIKVLAHFGIEVNSTRRETLCLCPAHDEDRPSCSVNTEKNLVNCHACGFAGDAFSVVMRRESVPYPAAVEIVEGITGESHRDVRGAARPASNGLSVRPGSYRPRYKNTPPRRRPLSS